MQPIRGLPRRELPAILEAVESVRTLPPDQLPRAAERDQDPPQVGLVANVLQAVLGDLCARKELSPSLVATVADVKLLVRAQMHGAPPPAESLLTQGWRAQHVLPDLQAVLEGRRTLRIANVRGESPFVVEDVGGR